MTPKPFSPFRSLLLPLGAICGLILACQGPAGPEGPAGARCSVANNGDGTSTISCPDGTTTTISNGAPGANGTAGVAGATGATGATGSAGDAGANGTSCSIVANPDAGTKTITCTDGTSVTVTNGTNGTNGENGGNVAITNFHGTDHLLAELLEVDAKYFVNAAVTSATADATGTVTVNFTVKDTANKPILGLKGISFNIAKLVPAATGEVTTTWVPYLVNKATVSGSSAGTWPNPDGTVANQGASESNGVLTDNGDGSYRYVFTKKLNAATLPVDGGVIAYERNRTHRISVMMGGHNGPTATATFDFVPDGTSTGLTRDIVQTAACKQCHGFEFHGHGGNRLTVENCVTCHGPASSDPQGGETIDFKVMVHKIHAGGELASIAGIDGKVWDDPSTTTNEAADNGSYAIWGYGNRKNEWWKAGFPAIIENCTKCHQGTGANVDNWKTVPSRAVCGSCHDNVNFATGANHPGGPKADDNACAGCHPASGTDWSITEAHDWTKHDPRNIPQYTATITVALPDGGVPTFFKAGDAPVATIVLKLQDGGTVDHTTVVKGGTTQGCIKPTDGGTCPTPDGLFATTAFYVHGPRALRKPALTTAARAAVLSATTGPWDISASGASLIVKVDNGEDLWTTVNGATSNVLPATITLAVPASSTDGGFSFFADKTQATAAEFVAWLNADAKFKARAIAYIDASGKLGIRSKNLGKLFAVQLPTSSVATALFSGTDINVVKLAPGSANSIGKLTDGGTSDPKVTWNTESITYAMDPVDNLQAGTYVATIELSDLGRVNETNYQAPTVFKAPFQVGTQVVEKLPANNCDSCHQSNGKGFVVDISRHNKILDNTALDQCGSCHDYLPGAATGEWTGGKPIAKRVHAVHFGSSLNYPLSTVDYQNGDPLKGRNWDITFPMDVRNCESCHSATSSGTWKTKAARLPCSGCHDSDAARGHMKAMTWDPTPADPWSSDEIESCQACH